MAQTLISMKQVKQRVSSDTVLLIQQAVSTIIPWVCSIQHLLSAFCTCVALTFKICPNVFL